MKSGVLAEPILVGRDRELEELQRYLDSAVEGKGNTVLISGEAGSGKTRLTTEFLKKAKKQGVTTLTGWCLSNAAVPYFPFFEAFNTYFTGEHRPKMTKQKVEVTAWLMGPSQAEKTGKPYAFSPQVWKDQTFVAVAKTLSSISAGNPVILFIDDVHWADSASLALIHYIARTMNSEKVLLLATFRSEQLTPDEEGRPHPLVEILRLMRREDLVKEIKLYSLTKTNVSELAEGMLGGDLQEQFAEKLADESQGNPLFIVESLRMLHERNGLIKEREQWRLASDEIGIPAKIKDIILQRLGTLSRNQRKVLDAASVIGEKFNAEFLGSMLGLDWPEIIETLDAIGQATCLVSCEGDLYRFDHARSRDAIYEEISPALRKVYHAKVAEKLENMPREGKLPFSDLTHHYAQAGNKEKATKYALAAGKDALEKWSNAEAIKHFTYVLQSVSQDPGRAEDREIALEGLGDAFFASSMFKESARVFEELGDTTEIAILRLRAFRKAMESTFQLSDTSYLMELVRKAEPYAAADRLENARVLLSRGRVFHLQSNFVAATKDMESALQVFEEEYSFRDAALALTGLGTYHAAWFSKLKEGLAEQLRAVALFEETGDFHEIMISRWILGLNLTNDLLLPEALATLTKLFETDEKWRTGDYLGLVYANIQLSRCFRLKGDFERALSFGLNALEFSKKTDALVARGMVYSDLTMQYTRLGDLPRAEEYFEKLTKLPPEVIAHPLVEGTLATAVFFAGKNQWDTSNKVFKEIFERARLEDPSWKLVNKIEYVWALERQRRSEEAEILREECQRLFREREEKFEHADLQVHLMVRKEVVVGEEFEMRFDLANVGRKPASMVKVENALDDDLKVVALPSWCNMQAGAIEMKNVIGPFEIATAKFTVKSLEAGTFTLNPKAVYIDDLGETRNYTLPPITITTNLPAPKERVAGKTSSGTPDLDRLLLGGIPENYAIVLASPSCDEIQLLITRFLEAGAKAGETTLYVTCEAASTKELVQQFPSNFSLLVCSLQADLVVQSLPNVYKLKGIDNLTEIDIALTKFFRTLDQSQTTPRRACIDLISDVLLQHHAIITRKWLSGLLANLKSKGFTTLAIVDPNMHPPEEVQAVLGLFEGEIRVIERETAKGTEKVLRIKKLYNQKYLENELTLTKER